MMSQAYKSIVFFLLVFLSGSVLAGSDGISTALSIGTAITAGNSESLQANASIISEGEKEGLGSMRCGVEANYSESTVEEVKETTVDNTKLFGNLKKTISKSTFGYVDASLLRDDIALIDYRGITGVGFGFYIIKSEVTELSCDAGVSYVWEDVDGMSDDYTAFRAAQAFKYNISDSAKIWESVEYLPQADESKNYLVNVEIGVEAALNATMSIRLVAQDKYDNMPAVGLERNDISIIAGISLKL